MSHPSRPNSLEVVGTCLPSSTNLDPHLDRPIDLLRSALIVDSELNDIAIFEWKGLRFLARRGEANVIQKGTRRRLGVSNEELVGAEGR